MESLQNINDRLQKLNDELELSRARMAKAITILTDIVDSILPHVVNDDEMLQQLRAASREARNATLF